jgi:hypothetical protein
MSLTLPAQTLRAVATDLRRLNYTPTSWQGLLRRHWKTQPTCAKIGL